MKSYAVLSTLIGGKGLVRETYLSRRRGERGKRKKERKNDRSSGSRYKCTKNRLRSRLEHSRCRGVRTLENVRKEGRAGFFFLCNFVNYRSLLLFCNWKMLNRPLRFFLTIYNGNETGKGTVSLLLVNRTILSDFFFFNCETVKR